MVFGLTLPPEAASFTNLRAAFFWQDREGTSRVLGDGYVYTSGDKTTGNLYVDARELEQLAHNSDFVVPFAVDGPESGEAFGKTDLQVSVPGIRSGVLYPVVWQDVDGNGTISGESEIVYQTNDRYGYASAPFSYSFGLPGKYGPDKNKAAVERGNRAEGWSRLRHVVLDPGVNMGEAPSAYQISMNSVTEQIFVMRKDSEYASSPSLTGMTDLKGSR